MLRFDDCICGTSTTGTGTLTLAAPPAAFGGIDPDVWARATGVGFGNSAAMLVDYVITEYTDATNLKEKQKEAGTGTLTLGASSGIANCTLARTTIDWTATSLDVQPASVSVKPAGGITIGTAANVLVMIAPRTDTVPGFSEYVDTGFGDGLGLLFPLHNTPSTALGGNYVLTQALADNYQLFTLFQPLYVKKASVRNAVAATGNTGTAWGRIYDIGSNGRPGICLVDFGQIGGTNALQTTGNISSAALTNAIKLTPGDYFFDTVVSSITGSPAWAGPNTSSTGKGSIPISGRMGSTGAVPYVSATTTGGTAGAVGIGSAANLTSYAPSQLAAASYYFWLSP